MVQISLPFRAISILNGESAVISISVSTLHQLISSVVTEKHISATELTEYVINRILACDRKELCSVLPRQVLNRLNKTYISVEKKE